MFKLEQFQNKEFIWGFFLAFHSRISSYVLLFFACLEPFSPYVASYFLPPFLCFDGRCYTSKFPLEKQAQIVNNIPDILLAHSSCKLSYPIDF